MNLRICGALAGLSYTRGIPSAHRFSSFSSLSEGIGNAVVFRADFRDHAAPFFQQRVHIRIAVLPLHLLRLWGLDGGTRPALRHDADDRARKQAQRRSQRKSAHRVRAEQEKTARTPPERDDPRAQPLALSDGLGWLIWLAPSIMPRGCRKLRAFIRNALYRADRLKERRAQNSAMAESSIRDLRRTRFYRMTKTAKRHANMRRLCGCGKRWRYDTRNQTVEEINRHRARQRP